MSRAPGTSAVHDVPAVDRALLALLKAQAAAEEAFGPGSAEVDALSTIVFGAIKQTADRDAGNTTVGPDHRSDRPDGGSK